MSFTSASKKNNNLTDKNCLQNRQRVFSKIYLEIVIKAFWIPGLSVG